MTEPTPRTVPSIGGISSPITELCNYSFWLRERLESAYREMEDEIRDPSRDHVPGSLWDVKLYAIAVTLFAAAAVEAGLNTYGLMRFGEEQFEKFFAYSGPVKRLRALLKYGRGLTLEDDDPLVEAVTGLSTRRNALVHQRAYESVVEGGTFQTPEEAWQMPNKVTDADASLREMEQFFTLFPNLDVEVATFLRPMPLPRRPPRSK